MSNTHIDNYIIVTKKIAQTVLGVNRELENKVKEIPVEPNPENNTRIEVNISETINMGSYNTIKISFGINLPVKKENIKEGFETAKNVVTAQLLSILENIKNE